MSGTIPPQLANLPKARVLYLHDNQLSGSIPGALGNTPSLLVLYLHGNQLSGTIPSRLANLSNLLRLYLHSNADLNGPIPTALMDLPLTDLSIQHTQVTVPTDAAFTAWLETITFSDGDRPSTGSIALAADNTTPRGLWSNGTTLWVVDSRAATVFAYTLATGARDTAKDIVLDTAVVADHDVPYGVWSNGTTLWVSDEGFPRADKVFAYTLATGARDVAKDIVFPMDESGTALNGQPREMWSDGTTLWVVDRSDRKLYAYDLAARTADPDKDIALASGNAAPRGLWGDGTTLWVADNNDDRLYAYDLATGDWDKDQDAILGPANLAPTGIWSNGTTWLVADPWDGKVYRYESSAPPPPTNLPAPTNLRARGGDMSVTLTWQTPGDGGSAIRKHQYRQKEGTGTYSGWMDIPTSAAGEAHAARYTVPSLTNGTTYTFEVRAENLLGLSGESNPASATPAAVTPPPPPPPPPPPLGGGSGSGGSGSGDGDQTGSAAVGYLENPGADSFQSGIGVISGWVCDAETVTLELDGVAHVAAYGTERGDTAVACGDTDNGFGLLFNWNLLGDGEHAVVAYVDDVELDRVTVTVRTLGEEFVRDVTGTCTVPDFPSMGETVTLAWQQSQQNFVLAEGAPPSGESRTGTAGVGYLENPGSNSFQSGIGVLSGWVCEGEVVEIEITPESGEVSRHVAGYGTERLDTQDTCGDTNNGFGLLFNWNLLGDGEHAVVAYVDDVELGRATVRVTTLGEEFLRGVAGECVVPDFPTVGEAVTLEWQQNQQNFVVTEVE